jgi:hypothetical protein
MKGPAPGPPFSVVEIEWLLLPPNNSIWDRLSVVSLDASLSTIERAFLNGVSDRFGSSVW